MFPEKAVCQAAELRKMGVKPADTPHYHGAAGERSNRGREEKKITCICGRTYQSREALALRKNEGNRRCPKIVKRARAVVWRITSSIENRVVGGRDSHCKERGLEKSRVPSEKRIPALP